MSSDTVAEAQVSRAEAGQRRRVATVGRGCVARTATLKTRPMPMDWTRPSLSAMAPCSSCACQEEGGEGGDSGRERGWGPHNGAHRPSHGGVERTD